MALNSLITSLTKAVSNTVFRQGNAFILSDNEAVAATLGRIKNATIAFEPINSEKDSTGRVNTLGYNVVGTVTMMQTTEDEIAAAGALSSPASADDGQNGFNIYLANDPTTTSAAITQWDSANMNGVGFKNALVQTSLNLDFGGGESMIVLTFEGHVSAAELRSFKTNNEIITFDL